ncbi:MAG: YbjQ family protein [Thermoplasmatota archaeon]|nr:YbjQ family protein [Halobacteriales archaeon]
MAAFRNIGGGEVVTYTRLANRVRHEAMERMVAEAQRLGANGVVGMRFDGSEIMPGNTEVFCYGTAVVLG